MKILFYSFLFFLFVNCYSQNSNEPRVLYEILGMDNAQVKTDITYVVKGDSSLVMDIYYPADFDFNSQIPAVLIVYGYSNEAQTRLMGKPFMKSKWYTSWCRLITTLNMAAIVYETTSPVADLASLEQHLRSNASDLNIGSIGLFSVSANSAVAMDALLNPKNDQFKCGVFLYPYIITLDTEYKETIAELVSQYRSTMTQLPDKSTWDTNRPIYLVQAGKDEIKGIKETTGEFLKAAHSVNLPLTFVNYQQGIHGFDAFQDSEGTKAILEDVLDFLAKNLN